jgi:hypothetical protein
VSSDRKQQPDRSTVRDPKSCAPGMSVNQGGDLRFDPLDGADANVV